MWFTPNQTHNEGLSRLELENGENIRVKLLNFFRRRSSNLPPGAVNISAD